MKNLPVESVSILMVMPQTKFEAITPKDVKGDALLAKAGV